jgi:thiosulfate reductase cytochrome b subunit
MRCFRGCDSKYSGELVTCIAIYKPVQFAWLTTLLGGYEWARWEHFWLAMGYVVFFVIHIAQVIRAGGTHSARWSRATISRR